MIGPFPCLLLRSRASLYRSSHPQGAGAFAAGTTSDQQVRCFARSGRMRPEFSLTKCASSLGLGCLAHAGAAEPCIDGGLAGLAGRWATRPRTGCTAGVSTPCCGSRLCSLCHPDGMAVCVPLRIGMAGPLTWRSAALRGVRQACPE